MTFKKKQTHKSPLETKLEESIKIKKYFAPEVMAVCGRSSHWTPSPCECTDTITCAYCILASLFIFGEES